MRSFVFLAVFVSLGLAARPFLNEPDTGIESALKIVNGSLPPLDRVLGLPDFDYVARNVMDPAAYAYVCHGAGSESSYRNNLEAYNRFRFRPRVMVDITNIDASLNTSILGHEFAVPFFISPFASAGLANPAEKKGLWRQRRILASQSSTLSMEEIGALKSDKQVIWQQVSISNLDKEPPQDLFKQIERDGMQAIVLTVDSSGDRTAYRSRRRLEDTSIGRDPRYTFMTWDYYQELQAMTSLPIIPKGIQTAEDARKAIEVGAPAIFLSNHGGRALDGSPSPLEIAWEIYQRDPSVFEEIEVYADGGVRYGTDLLKLMSLGVSRAISLLTKEVTSAGANLGLADIKDIEPSFVSCIKTLHRVKY
ncbi:hypothetical protein BGZ61DRAFT_500688 [Ilyonectria robusta]|uniref:uncharacterized protein n=1 Tax=Ilyonectria robusta TaxID=1079257 RepID=UPI001E8D49B0|nr:uncharacterized protein BGZ61DRAFT_500688 [Ilyonectria robusta]KAH8653923.1 hypothetical protein BGZ61DRAFT_500688 [Ilyonectria robusta]